MRPSTRLVVLGKKKGFTSFTSAGFFCTFNGGIRFTTYEVAYSDDNINYTTSFSGIAIASTCGIVNSSEKGFPVVARYWRYQVPPESSPPRHHPRCSRIFLSNSEGITDIKVYTQDNCNDSGGIPGFINPGTIIYDAVNRITISG